MDIAGKIDQVLVNFYNEFVRYECKHKDCKKCLLDCINNYINVLHEELRIRHGFNVLNNNNSRFAKMKRIEKQIKDYAKQLFEITNALNYSSRELESFLKKLFQAFYQRIVAKASEVPAPAPVPAPEPAVERNGNSSSFDSSTYDPVPGYARTYYSKPSAEENAYDPFSYNAIPGYAPTYYSAEKPSENVENTSTYNAVPNYKYNSYMGGTRRRRNRRGGKTRRASKQ